MLEPESCLQSFASNFFFSFQQYNTKWGEDSFFFSPARVKQLAARNAYQSTANQQIRLFSAQSALEGQNYLTQLENLLVVIVKLIMPGF